jgi:hypothetical protein
MNSKGILSYTARIAIIVTAYVTLVFSTTTVKQDLDTYFAKIDETLTAIQKSSAIKSIDLKLAENLFVRELKRNQSFYAFYRANSKGKVVSELVRMKSVERTGTNVEKEQWFKAVEKNKEDFYTVFKDEERGRYYLIWSKPILKKEQFKGAVCLKVDLWDCFYDYSNGIYYPILVKLGKKTLFSHKWNDVINSTEERLVVPGIKNISVKYIAEKKVEVKDTVAKLLPVKDTVIAKIDSSLVKKAVSLPAPKKGNNGILIFVIIAGIAAVVIVIIMIVSKKRKDAILRKIEQDDF